MKRLWAALVAVGLCFFVAGCSDDSSSSSSGGVVMHGQEIETEGQMDTSIPSFTPNGGVFTSDVTLRITCTDAKKIYFYILEEPRDGDGKWDESTWNTKLSESTLSSLGKVTQAPTATAATSATTPIEAGKWYSYDPSSAPIITLNKRCVVRAVGEVGEGANKVFRTALTSFDFYDPSSFTSTAVTQDPTTPAMGNSWADQSVYFIMTDRFNSDLTGSTSSKTTANLQEYYKAGDGTVTSKNHTAEARTGTNEDGYDGGNLKGIEAKLNYIKDMGFTAIFITPPIKNLIFDGGTHGYHGYWPSDFMAVDPHFGTLASYQAFVKAAHTAGLRVIQDFSINALGDYQRVDSNITSALGTEGSAMSAGDITKAFSLNMNGEHGLAPFAHPESLPWALNKVTDFSMDELTNSSPYNFNIKKDGMPLNSTEYQLQDLDDIRYNGCTTSLMRGYLRYWIDAVGVDGYRFNGAMGVKASYVRNLLINSTAGDEGAITYGDSKKRGSEFLVFGELQTSESVPVEREVAKYTTGNGFSYIQNSALAYSLHKAIVERDTTELYKTLTNRATYGYKGTTKFINFVDDHDTNRWLKTTGNPTLAKMGYNILFTIEGIPQVYYGSEQGFNGERRQAMFTGGYKHDGGKDFDDTASNWYKYFTAINKMRKDYRVFRHNTLTVLTSNSNGNGLFAYLVQETDAGGSPLSGVGQKALIIQNPSISAVTVNLKGSALTVGDKFTLIDKLGEPTLVAHKTEGEDGAYTVAAASVGSAPYDKVSSVEGVATLKDDFVVGNEGTAENKIARINLEVPAQSCAVYLLSAKDQAVTPDATKLSITKVSTKVKGSSGETDSTSDVVTNDTTKVVVKGKTGTAGKVFVVMDDNLTDDESALCKIVASATADTEFSVEFNAASLSNAVHYIKLVQKVSPNIFVSGTKSLMVDRKFVFNTEVKDKGSDFKGVPITVSSNTVSEPLNVPTYQEEAERSSTDLQGVEVYTSGSNIRLGIRTTQVSHNWNPQPNSFDHAAFYIFIARKDKTATATATTPATCTAFPLHGNYTFPTEVGTKGQAGYKAGFEGWDYLYVAEGWNNQFYSSSGADGSGDHFGAVAGPTPRNDVSVDWNTLQAYYNQEQSKYMPWAKPDWTKWLASSYSTPLKGSLTWTSATKPPDAHNNPAIIWFTISADAIGNPADIEGWKIFITTWDFDSGNPRALQKLGTKTVGTDTVDETRNDYPYRFTTKYDDVPWISDALDEVIVIK